MSWKGLKHIPVYAAYALLFKHKGVSYPVEPEVFICKRLNLI